MGWHDLTPIRGQNPDSQDLEQAAAHEAALRAGPLARCDARSVWAVASDFRGFTLPPNARGRDPSIAIAVEFDPAASDNDRELLAKAAGRRGIYNPADGFWTGSVALSELGNLQHFPALKGWRIGLPNIPGGDTTMHIGGWLLKFLIPPKVVIGIIDHGIAVVHAAFRWPGAKQTRVAALWDQDPGRLGSHANPVGLWKPVAGLGYGGEVRADLLDRLIASHPLDDAAIYRALRYEPAQRRVGHGTHVLDLAAGRPDPRAPRAAADAASLAPIVAVQLPYLPAKDASGSALCVHVLDALHYIERSAPPNCPVVINLSDGAYGGAHDGQSMLERAIDDFLRAHPRVTLVLAAGNARESRGHGRVGLLRRRQRVAFHWRVLPDDLTDSFLEVWLDRACPPGSAALTVTPAGAAAGVMVELGGNELLVDASGNVIASVISRLDSPDSPGRSMFLVALGPTRPRRGASGAVPHGAWRIEVKNLKVGPSVSVDAWVERDNPVINESGPRRQSFLEPAPGGPDIVDGQGTLGSLAGSGQAFVVGGRYLRGAAFDGDDAANPTDVARYSSRGPARAVVPEGPDAIAPSDDSPVLHGLLAAANRSGTSFRMDGTSVAAPIVTRRIANLVASSAPRADRAAIDRALCAPHGPQPDHDLTGARCKI